MFGLVPVLRGVIRPPLAPFYPGPGLPLTPGPPGDRPQPADPLAPGQPEPPEPRMPAPLLPLPFPSFRRIKRFLRRVLERLGQDWGPKNSRPERKDKRTMYRYYRTRGPNFLTGWKDTEKFYPAASVASFACLPTGISPWPGQMTWKAKAGTSVGGGLVEYGDIDKTVGVITGSTLWKVLFGSLTGEQTLTGLALTYEFKNDANSPDPIDTWPGAGNPFPGAPNNTDPTEGVTPEGPGLTPETAPVPLVPLPKFPVPLPTLPRPVEPQPAPNVAPLVPTVTPAPALVTTQQTARQPFYRPNPLPAPLRPPATATTAVTTAATLAPVAPAPVPETPQDARQYGTKTVTSGAPRVDPQAVAEELGRVEQKLGIMLQGLDTTPDWLDALAGRLIGDLLAALLDALVVDVPGTTYEYTAPCDKDAEGNPVEWTAEIAAADYQPAIVARLDAIADALGVLKGWKQPNCRTSPPRSNVTVTAYEIGPEA